MFHSFSIFDTRQDLRRKRITYGWIFLGILLCFMLSCATTNESENEVAKSESTRAIPLKTLPEDPILRLETAFHTQRISQIDVDQKERYVVTGSSDKTVRVWDLHSGQLVRTLRPPIGPDQEGRIFAVAISPDAKTIACAGWTGKSWDGKFSIYLFNRLSGQLENRISGLEASVSTLTYSQDGKVLAATLHGSYGHNGVRMYRTSDDRLIAEHREYGAESYGADFDHLGRLVTSSFDGFIRLYDKEFTLLAQEKISGGTRPVQVTFNPAGDKIAVGFEDSGSISVISGQDLSFLYSPAQSTVAPGSLNSVAWSHDGQSLLAAGTLQVQGYHPIRKWSNQGRGSYQDIPTVRNTIFDIDSLENGGFLFGAAGGSFGLFDRSDNAVFVRRSGIADFRDNRGALRVSSDGTGVQFPYSPEDDAIGHFSLKNRVLISNPIQQDTLYPPLLQVPELTIDGWSTSKLSTALKPPKINNVPVSLQKYEIARSYAITPDHQGVVVGTTWYLRLLNTKGREQWKVPIPGDAWSINIPQKGKVVVVALGDGTIRWYRLADGKHILTLFPHSDKRRWIVWSAEGYYDASPGAESLLGWHKNRAKNSAADFYPAGRFRAVSYRPDIIANIVKLWDESEALKLANHEKAARFQALSVVPEAKESVAADINTMSPSKDSSKHSESGDIVSLAPVLTIHSPGKQIDLATPFLTIGYSIQTSSEEQVSEVFAEIDGARIPTSHNLQVVGTTSAGEPIRQLLLTVPPRDSQVFVYARHQNRISAPATIQVKWQPEVVQDFSVRPNLYVLSIGISRYQSRNWSVPTAANDARMFADLFQAQDNQFYRRVKAKVLTDNQVSKDAILDGLDWIDHEMTSKDVAMIFVAGHTVLDQRGIPHFLTIDTQLDKIFSTGLVITDIQNTVLSMAGKTLLFLDTCHVSNPLGVKACPKVMDSLTRFVSTASKETVLFSSTHAQPVVQNSGGKHGAFAQALRQSLTRETDPPTKDQITVSMLDLFLKEQVKDLTDGQQQPLVVKPLTVQDFSIMAHTPPPSIQAQSLSTLIDDAFPPVITILSPLDGTVVDSQKVTIKYSIGGMRKDPVSEIMVLLDGRPLPTKRGVTILENIDAYQTVNSLDITIPKKDSQISLIAKNRWGASQPSSVNVVWQGPTTPSQTVRKPNLYLLAVGISQYEDSALRLQFAAKDAKDFSQAVKMQIGKLYENVVVKTLVDEKATKRSILSGLEWISEMTTTRDVAAIFFAGHGVNANGGIYYFLPINAKTNRLRSTGLPFSDIRNIVASLSGKSLVFVDTCHSGNVMGARRDVPDLNALVNELTSAENGGIVFASSTGRQYSLEDAAWNNGAFTKALVEGLTGAADYTGDGVITLNMLDLYLSERVKKLTEGQQTPTTTKPQTIQDFPIALVN